jgi:hypothetical protein
MDAPDTTRILDMLSDDPNGWVSEVNRFQAHLILTMRGRGFADGQILDLLHEVTGRAHPSVWQGSKVTE